MGRVIRRHSSAWADMQGIPMGVEPTNFVMTKTFFQRYSLSRPLIVLTNSLSEALGFFLIITIYKTLHIVAISRLYTAIRAIFRKSRYTLAENSGYMHTPSRLNAEWLP